MSGVGTQARFLISGLLSTGRYSFRCFGGAIKHENYDTVMVDNNPDWIIKPTNGFGDRNMLRQALVQERPDVLMLFTDPRFFLWVWEMEDEVHQVCPIAYNHLWDNYPTPTYNRVLYESTDLINCINYPTYEMVKELQPSKVDSINYIPHAVPKDLYFPLPRDEAKKHKTRLIGPERDDHLIYLFVSRNARRKNPSDVIVSFKHFIDRLQVEHGHRKATLLMHTNPNDPEGPNLHHVVELLQVRDNVVFSKDQIGFRDMNVLYNISDCLVNFSMNEGFGLGLLEAKMTGRPVIAVKTGGMTRQVVDHRTGEQLGIGMDPEVTPLVGNQVTPFIYEDLVSHGTLTNAMYKFYEWGPEKRAEVGKRAMLHAHRDYDLSKTVSDWDRSLTKLVRTWKESHVRWKGIDL